MDKTYKSKIDWWLGAILVLIVITSLIGFVASLFTGELGAIVAMIPTLLLGAGLPVWLMTSTRYTLSGKMLLVKCGPFSWEIDVTDINSIKATRNPLSSPALSLDRLRIEYGLGRAVMISPQNKDQFLQDIKSRRS